MITVELVPNGAQIQVTEENKEEFINHLVSYWLSRHATEVAALNELLSIDPKLHDELKWMLEHEITSAGTDQVFTTTEKQSGVAISIDLVPEGSKIVVTEQNKREYVNEMISHRMNQHTRDRATLRELENIDQELYHELTWMLDTDITDALKDLTFTVTKKRAGKVFSKDLVPNGRDITVTEDNKQEYVNELVSHRLMEHAQRVETVNNVKSIDVKLHLSLKSMMENKITGIIEGGFTITDIRSGKLVELVPDGRNVTVTEENKLEFIDAVEKYFQGSQSGRPQQIQKKKSRKWYHF
ncbi:hypothetical protein FB45DRAFT_236169 [Roridomyces roridus]|uniref:HECT-type E3 ubiquitin transferase n=1 Tax=Roridomyces roridus TaxID=1738132 RepID=A0AAD7BB16_9AGAR|nr:hypothetical protein FB45DRAFT_236169 [Roridomyces roridus]